MRRCYAVDARFATRAAASFSRQLLPSNFSRCPRSGRPASKGVTTTVSPRKRAQSSTGRLDVTQVDACSYRPNSTSATSSPAVAVVCEGTRLRTPERERDIDHKTYCDAAQSVYVLAEVRLVFNRRPRDWRCMRCTAHDHLSSLCKMRAFFSAAMLVSARARLVPEVLRQCDRPRGGRRQQHCRPSHASTSDQPRCGNLPLPPHVLRLATQATVSHAVVRQMSL